MCTQNRHQSVVRIPVTFVRKSVTCVRRMAINRCMHICYICMQICHMYTQNRHKSVAGISLHLYANQSHDMCTQNRDKSVVRISVTFVRTYFRRVRRIVTNLLDTYLLHSYANLSHVCAESLQICCAHICYICTQGCDMCAQNNDKAIVRIFVKFVRKSVTCVHNMEQDIKNRRIAVRIGPNRVCLFQQRQAQRDKAIHVIGAHRRESV